MLVLPTWVPIVKSLLTVCAKHAITSVNKLQSFIKIDSAQTVMPCQLHLLPHKSCIGIGGRLGFALVRVILGPIPIWIGIPPRFYDLLGWIPIPIPMQLLWGHLFRNCGNYFFMYFKDRKLSHSFSGFRVLWWWNSNSHLLHWYNRLVVKKKGHLATCNI